MASSSLSQPWLLVLEIIKHHEKAERFQQFILDMMWERGKIEVSYIKSLQQWADDYIKRCKNDDVPYEPPVVEALSQPVREAKAQANQHQRLYNVLMNDDGPCAKLRTAMIDIRNSVMPSNSQRVFTTLVSQFISLHNQRREHEMNVNKWKQHFAHAQYAAMGLGGKFNLKRTCQSSRPLSAKKQENLESKQFHLKKFADIQEGQLKTVERNLEEFMENQIQPLKSMYEDLGYFAKHRLVDTIQMVKLFIQRLQSHEGSSERKEKRKTMLECEKALGNFVSSNYAEEILNNLNMKANETVERQLSKNQENIITISLSKQLTSLLLAKDFPAPIATSEPNSSEKEHQALPRQNKKLHCTQTANRKSNSDVPADKINTNSSSTTTKKSENKTLKSDNNGQAETIHTENKEAIEILVLPSEKKTLSKEKLPWSVKDFCAETEIMPFLPEPPKLQTKKRLMYELYDGPIRTDVTDISKHENERSSRSTTPPVTESAEDEIEGTARTKDVTEMSNVRVVALHDYTARNENELSFSKDQVIQQKLCADEYGFSYGWTRTNKFSSKKHGYYPAQLVRLQDDSTSTKKIK